MNIRPQNIKINKNETIIRADYIGNGNYHTIIQPLNTARVLQVGYIQTKRLLNK